MNKELIYEEIITNIFPSGNVGETKLIVKNNTVSIHNNETHNPGDKIYFFKRTDGFTTFAEHVYEQPSNDLLALAGAFKTILTQHFGPGSETNTSINESTVVSYFIERQLSRISTQWDTGDAQLLKEAFVKIKEWTKDNTTWSFPWHLVN